MYEDYTRQALPSKYYRELLGSAMCVFNSNNAFIIENILKKDKENKYDWYKLIDKTSGQLKSVLENIFVSQLEIEKDITQLFCKLVDKRNRLIHSFQITDNDGKQRLATKDRNNNQYIISESMLLDFIKLNEELSNKLYILRGY
ncbi:selenium binding protein [Prevotella nigrescens]|uniref:selenium binding protein n=1 Tax=Prevotella nigrescens TaxID=28133 RepID=UPI001BAE47DC|nr:selenium binding protein [Prevotella nigrescens]QUB50841.1 selenium binding protein [Prevotella nigrescens]